jgi:hypothetical protein
MKNTWVDPPPIVVPVPRVASKHTAVSILTPRASCNEHAPLYSIVCDNSTAARNEVRRIILGNRPSSHEFFCFLNCLLSRRKHLVIAHLGVLIGDLWVLGSSFGEIDDTAASATSRGDDVAGINFFETILFICDKQFSY